MSYSKILYHIVFRTKRSLPAICEEHEKALYSYIWGFLKNRSCFLYRIGGTPDHIHILVQVPVTEYMPDLIRDMKTAAHRFVADNHSKFPLFDDWGKSYCALSVSYGDRTRIINYIKGQKEHHRKASLADELKNIFKEHDVEYDTRYLFTD